MRLNILLKMRKSILTPNIISISSLDIFLLSMLIAYGLFSIPVQLIAVNNQAPSYDLTAQYYLTELENMNGLMAEMQTSIQQCLKDNKIVTSCSIPELTSSMQSMHKMTDNLIVIIRAQNTQSKNK